MSTYEQTATTGTPSVDWPHEKAHDFATLELVRRAPASSLAGADPAVLFPATPDFAHQRTMDWTPRATREDVFDVVSRFVRTKFELRASKLSAIDESRPQRGRVKKLKMSDLWEMSWPQMVDAVRTTEMRLAVYAAPERAPERDAKGEPLNSVAPIRDVAPIVRGKCTRPGVQHASIRDWRDTVGSKIKEAGAEILVEAEEHRQARIIERNRLAAARSEVERFRGGGRNARNLRRHAEERVAELKAKVAYHSDRISDLARTADYRNAPDRLLRLCTATEAIERDIFGDRQ